MSASGTWAALALRQKRSRHGHIAGKSFRRLRHLANRVQKLLRSQTPHIVMGKMARVVLVARVRQTGQLIGLRIEDQAEDVLQIVLVADQLLGHVVEQLGILRRVRRPQVVGLVNDSPPQQPIPNPIHGVAGEPGILGRREPLSKAQARVVLRGQIQNFAAQQLRLDAFLFPRTPQSALGIEEDDFLFPFVGRLETYFAEERGHAHVVVQGPFFRGMAMAAGAAQPGPHENQRRHVGKALRVLIAHGPVVVARSVPEIAAAGGQQLPDKLIVGLVLAMESRTH